MKRIASALLLSVAISAPAFAANEGGYVAVDAGQVNYSNATSTTGTNASFPNPKTFRFGVGYHFNQFVGVEAGYSVIGDSTITTVGTGLTVTETAKASSYGVAAVGTYPINEMFDVFAKVGAATLKGDYTGSATNGVTASGSASKTTLMFGVGAQYNFNQHFGVRVQYEDLGKTDDITIAFSNGNRLIGAGIGVKVYSAGVVYNF